MLTQENAFLNSLIPLRGEAAYSFVEEYLKHHEPSNDLLIRLAIFFENPPFADYTMSLKFVDEILHKDATNPYANIMLAFIYTFEFGEIPRNTYERLDALNNEDPEIQSMIEYVKSWHWKMKDKKKFVEVLENSISLCDKYVLNYFDLSSYYRDIGEKEKGILLIKAGLANVKKIYNGSNDNEDILDEFLGERIKGIYITKSYYDICDSILG